MNLNYNFQEISFKSITEQLYDYLSESIIEGKIGPGEKLNEIKLCQEFGISRSPLRECFRILEAESLIDIIPRKGAFVRKVTRKDIEDFFPVRAKLEGLAATLAVQHITEEEISTLDDLLKKMDGAYKKGDVKSFFRLNDTFHGVFLRASRNEILEKIIKNINKGIWQRISYLYFESPYGINLSNEKHKEIVETFKRKDNFSAGKVVEEHILQTQEQFLLFWDNRGL